MSYRVTMHAINEDNTELGELLSEDWFPARADAVSFAQELRDEARDLYDTDVSVKVELES